MLKLHLYGTLLIGNHIFDCDTGGFLGSIVKNFSFLGYDTVLTGKWLLMCQQVQTVWALKWRQPQQSFMFHRFGTSKIWLCNTYWNCFYIFKSIGSGRNIVFVIHIFISACILLSVFITTEGRKNLRGSVYLTHQNIR